MDHLLAYLFLAAFVAGFGAYAAHRLWRAWGRYAVARLMDETRTSRVCDLGSSRRPLVEVAGVVAKRGDLLEAPVSRVPCVYYELVVEELGRDSENRPKWTRRLREMKRVGFGVFDGTGTVAVDVTRGEVLFDVDATGEHGFKSASSPELVRAMAKRKQIVRTAYGPDQLRYRETVLEDGDRIYVLGAYDGERVRKSKGGVLVVADTTEQGARRRLLALARSDIVCAACGLAVALFFAGLALFPLVAGR